MNKREVVLSTLLLLFFVACLALQAQAQSPKKSVEGSWQGALGEGAVRLRLVLTISKTSEGAYRSVMDSVDQHATIPAEKTSLDREDGDKLRIEFPRVGGLYEGTLSQDGSEIKGTWTQGGVVQPLSFQRRAPGSSSSGSEAARSEAAGSQPAPPRLRQAPVDVVVPIAPIAFRADGKTHLVYELHITNFSPNDLVLTRVEALNDAGAGAGKSLLRTDGADLVANTLLVGASAAAGLDKLRLTAGRQTVVYMWITLAGTAPVPLSLKHRVTVKAGGSEDEVSVECARLAIGHDVAVIAPPLRSDNWAAINGPSNTSVHRRALFPVDGRAHIAQRFAIDWVRLNADGKTSTGDPKDNKNYRCYGVEALAVAEGTVTEIKDGIPENIPGANSRAVPMTLETLGGNSVVIDIGHGHFAFYAHLQPGSLRVKVGDHVKTGQVVGLVGNSGNSTEPHLHFHLSDTNSPLATEGIPYAFASFSAKARRDASPEEHNMEIPSEGEIVTFPARP